MIWGVPIWIWLVFLVTRVIWISLGAILWVYFFSKVMWNKKIEEKYYGDMLREKRTEEGKAEKR